MEAGSANISVVIPTYQREKVLLNTINYLQSLNQCPAEIIVVDQTLKHERKTDQLLSRFDKNGIIRWIRLQSPSIPKAMNIGIYEASHPIVLFVDDDIIPAKSLIGAHEAAYQESEDIWAIVGQVLQPGE
jgi:glycosyltransferase involved in cell wall biosynthesis